MRDGGASQYHMNTGHIECYLNIMLHVDDCLVECYTTRVSKRPQRQLDGRCYRSPPQTH